MEKIIGFTSNGLSQFDDTVWNTLTKVTDNFRGNEFDGHVGMDMASFTHLLVLSGAKAEPSKHGIDIIGISFSVDENDFTKFIERLEIMLITYVKYRFPDHVHLLEL